jgi:hypothetical protein
LAPAESGALDKAILAAAAFALAWGRQLALVAHGLDQGLDGRLLKAWRASDLPLAKLIFAAVMAPVLRRGGLVLDFASVDDAALVEMIEEFVGCAPAEARAAPSEDAAMAERRAIVAYLRSGSPTCGRARFAAALADGIERGVHLQTTQEEPSDEPPVH